MSEEIMLTEKQQAEALHKQITGYGEVIYQSLYGMCTAIKQMRDSKLYRALGHSTFEEYAEEKLGMSRSQAYNYITIAEKLTEDFVQPVGQIGMRKLLMLTALTDDQREEIAQTVDLESTTVRELKEQIAALKEESELDRKERDNANEAAQRWKNTAQSAQADNRRLENQVQSLTDQVKDAEEARENTRLTLKGMLDKRIAQVHKLEAQIQELENKPQDVAVVDRTEEIDRLNAEIERLRQQINEKPDTQLALGVEPIYQNDTKAVFKPYLTAAIDALNRLTAFMEQNIGDDNMIFFVEKSEAALTIVGDRIAKLKGV